MKEQNFKSLLEKYFDDTLTYVEAELLHQFDEKLTEKETVYFKDEKHRLEIKSSIFNAIHKKQKKAYTKLWKVASILLFLIGFGTMEFYHTTSIDEEVLVQITHTTNWGQQKNIVLPDGSKVKLNVGSSISFPEQFDKSKRKVILNGEAFFNVVKKKEAPFVVYTDEVTTTVLGTSFNINTKEKEHISVTVATGKVHVAAKNTTEVILTPKQQACYNVSSNLYQQKSESKQIPRLEKGILHFDNVTLVEATKTLEQWYNVPIEILNDDIAKCRFSGKFNSETLPTVLESLANLKVNMEYIILEKGEVQIKGVCN